MMPIVGPKLGYNEFFEILVSGTKASVIKKMKGEDKNP